MIQLFKDKNLSSRGRQLMAPHKAKDVHSGKMHAFKFSDKETQISPNPTQEGDKVHNPWKASVVTLGPRSLGGRPMP